MAKRSRSKSSFNFRSGPFIAGILVVFAIVGIIYFSMNGADVKGTNIFKPPTSNITRPDKQASTSGSKCSTRVTSFSLSGVCTSNSERDKFTTASYTCSNGTTATITRDCFNAGDAFARANIACAKSAGCMVPSPKPQGTPTGIFKPQENSTSPHR